eukprot:2279573-Prymnesium_polylepis.1
MSKATLIQLTEDAKAMTHARVLSETLWKTNKRQKTQATTRPTPPAPLWNSPLTEEGYFSDMEYFGIKFHQPTTDLQHADFPRTHGNA